jgi:hypothetical protein
MLRPLVLLIETALNVVLAAQSPPQPAPTYRFGKDQLAIEDDAPRICWVPTRGPADAKIIPAADFPPTFGQSPPGTAFPNPRPLWRRKLRVDAHVWAVRPNFASDGDTSKDYDACEALCNHLVATIHGITFGSYEIAGEDWTTEQASTQRKGIVNILSVVFYLPWTREPDTTAEVITMPIVPEGT